MDWGVQLVTLHTRDLSLDEPPSVYLSQAIEAWHGWRHERAMPAWTDVNLLDIPHPSLKMTLVLDIHYDPLKFHYRFWGTGLTRIHGLDLTGKTTNELPWPDFRALTEQAYRRVMQDRSPWLYVGEYIKPYDAVGEEYVLRLPLSNDGERVDGIISVVEQIDSTTAT